MTNLRKIILIPALIMVSISSFISCGVDRWPEYAHQTALDSWIYDIMQQNYLWYEALPTYDEVNLFQEPAAFLSKVKISQDSYSFVDSVMDAPLPTYGFDYTLVRSIVNDTAYNALITYVIPDSPAADAGLKRGNWIMKVDTSYISRRYETQLLQGTQAVELTLGEWKEVEIESEIEGEDPTKVFMVVPIEGEPVEMPAARVVEDNPVHKYEILSATENGREIKVGYLMYNSFIAGTRTEPQKYNNELRRVSQEFATADVERVILDLRYNAGGTIDCVQLLGTILTSASRLNEPMAFLQYNNKNTDRDTTLIFDEKVLESGVNLNQSGLFVITSATTAGAPEMLIHSLSVENVYPIVSIGSATKGQNVATEQFINEEFRWSVNPVVSTVYNAEHDSYGSYTPHPDLRISDNNYSEFLPFGDPNERLLKVAIGVIEGTFPPKDEEEETPENASFKIEKIVNSPASRRYLGGNGLKIK